MNKPKSTSKGVDRNIRSSWKKRMRFHCGKTQAEADVNSVQSAKVAAGFLAIWKENEREGPRSSNKPLKSSKATILTSCSLRLFLPTVETVIVCLIISTTIPLTYYQCSFHRQMIKFIQMDPVSLLLKVIHWSPLSVRLEWLATPVTQPKGGNGSCPLLFPPIALVHPVFLIQEFFRSSTLLPGSRHLFYLPKTFSTFSIVLISINCQLSLESPENRVSLE